MGARDQAVRLSAAFILLITALDVFAVAAGTRGVWAVPALAFLSVVMAVTGLARSCPVYGALGFSTAA